MIIGERVRAIRTDKKLSQGDLERRSGLLRCYISRVEHGYTVPSLETLEKLARGLNVPMYRLFYEGTEAPSVLKLTPKDDEEWGNKGQEADDLSKLRRLLARMKPFERTLVLHITRKMAQLRRH